MKFKPRENEGYENKRVFLTLTSGSVVVFVFNGNKKKKYSQPVLCVCFMKS